MANLLSTPSLVQTPFIIVQIGEYTFGDCSKQFSNGNQYKIKYPNFVKSLSIDKINGQVNTYTLDMEYKITAGDDPNFMDRVFSTITDTRIITLSYGDWSNPSFIYRKEEVLVTDVDQSVNFSDSSITYTVKGTSTSIGLSGQNYTFQARKAKPSEVIRQIVKNSTYHIQDVFTGMQGLNDMQLANLIPSTDVTVDIQAKIGVNILEYINYLVSCMVSASGTTYGSVYYLNIVDDIYNKYGGPYFQIIEVTKSIATASVSYQDAYEITVGYPTNNLITGFNITSNDQWNLLYSLSNSSTTTSDEYQYLITPEGDVNKVTSPSITRMTNWTASAESLRWWTQVTAFPITVTVTMKGLIRPAVLMTYIKLNVLFYGCKHSSSGVYVITKQSDSINGSGYTTTLTLLKVSGDDSLTALNVEGSSKTTQESLQTWWKSLTGTNSSTTHTSSSGSIHGGGGTSFSGGGAGTKF